MGRVARSSLPNGIFHVFSRGNPELVPFPADIDRDRMLNLTRNAERKFGLEMLACVVMSTHFHYVVEATQENLSSALHWVKACYARDFNRRHDRFGAVFAGRFECRCVESEEQLATACAYVRGNPVEAGLCASIEDWPWAYGSWRVEA